MNERVEAVQKEQIKTADGDVMFTQLAAIRELPSAAQRVEAWEDFISTYERMNLNEMCEEIMWRAETYLKIDRASAEINQLAG
jgi:hypothetical protein